MSDTTDTTRKHLPAALPTAAQILERLRDPLTAWVPVAHAAVVLGLGRTAAYRAARSGFLADGIEVVRIGARKWGVPAAHLRRFLGWPADGRP